MFSFLDKFFGSGNVAFEIVTDAGETQRGKTTFSGSIDSEQELAAHIINSLALDELIVAKKIRIIGVSGTTKGRCSHITGAWFERKS